MHNSFHFTLSFY